MTAIATPKKGGRKKNEELTAERHEMREALSALPGESTAAALARVLREKEDGQRRLEEHVKKLGEMVTVLQADKDTEAVAAVANGGKPAAPEDPNVSRGPHAGVPVDTAIYLRPGQTLPQPPPGTMTAQTGDMGESYIRWLLANAGPDAVREKYGERWIEDSNRVKVRLESRYHLLPPDVQAAIK